MPDAVLGALFVLTHLIHKQSKVVDSVIVFIFHIRKLRHREVKKLAQGHRTINRRVGIQTLTLYLYGPHLQLPQQHDGTEVWVTTSTCLLAVTIEQKECMMRGPING